MHTEIIGVSRIDTSNKWINKTLKYLIIAAPNESVDRPIARGSSGSTEARSFPEVVSSFVFQIALRDPGTPRMVPAGIACMLLFQM